MLKKHYQIIAGFIEKPWKKFTFKEIKKLTGKKSESYIYNSLKKFVKTDILVEEKAGNVILYSLNFSSLKTLVYIGFISEHIAWNQKHLPYKELENIMPKIPTNFFVFLVTGSYAKNAQRKDSDIDIVIICEDCLEPKKVYSELRHECEMSIPRIHLYVFKKTEFLKMLIDKKANYGREIANNNLVLFGGEEYYSLVSEAIKNGFVG